MAGVFGSHFTSEVLNRNRFVQALKGLSGVCM